MKALATVESVRTCPACGAVRPGACHLAVELGREDTWSALGGLLEAPCSECGRPIPADRSAVLVEAGAGDDSPGYLLLPVRAAPSPAAVEQGRRFLRDQGMPLFLVLRLVPTRWPPIDDDAPVLAGLEADPVTVAQASAQARRRTVHEAVIRLAGVTSARHLRGVLEDCPELGSEGVDAVRELLPVLGWNPEESWPAQAHRHLVGALSPSATDADLAAAYQAFDEARANGIAQAHQAGHRLAGWLGEHGDAPAAEWDATAVEALRLLGLGGDEYARATLLDGVGVHVIQRPDATPEQVSWGIECLREARALWNSLGDSDQEAAVGGHLAAALHAWDYGDALSNAGEAVTVMREVCAYYERVGQTSNYAMAATNLAVVLLKTAEMESRPDHIEEAVGLCRRALPLRPKALDPVGWAFCAANLALALKRLGSDDPAVRRSQLQEAAAVDEQAAQILAAHGHLWEADQARVNRGDCLIGLAGELRRERMRVAVGGDSDGGGVAVTQFVSLLDLNPGVFGLAEPPPEIAELEHGPAAPDEAEILAMVVNEATGMLAEPRVQQNAAVRSRLARVLASACSALLGSTPEAADALAATRRLIDATVAPEAAASTAGQLANLLTRLDRWEEAAAAYDDCLSLHEAMLLPGADRRRAVETLARFPNLARWAAHAHVRSGDLTGAVMILERTRSRSLPRFVPAAGGGLDLFSWRSPTLEDIGRAATRECPIAYVLTAPGGSVVLLVRRSAHGTAGVTGFESELTSGFFVTRLYSMLQPSDGLLTAQLIGSDVGPAIEALVDPLGSLLEPVAAELLRAGIRDLVLIPAGPTAVFPWAAAGIRPRPGAPAVPVGELLTLSVAPSAAAVVLGRQRRAGGVGDAVAGRVLVVADPERPDAAPLPGAREEAQWIESAFPGRVDVLQGDAARTAAVLGRLPFAWIAHLACHGTNNVLAPEAMRLLLSDGELTLEQLLRLPQLRARLVVLSACQTGQIDTTRATDEMLGLPLAFLQAGAGAVVSALWPIDDRVTAMLVGRFYEELAAAMGSDGRGDVALALTRAQRWLRSLTVEQAHRWRQERGMREPSSQRSVSRTRPTSELDRPFTNPYFWAGFVAYGR